MRYLSHEDNERQIRMLHRYCRAILLNNSKIPEEERPAYEMASDGIMQFYGVLKHFLEPMRLMDPMRFRVICKAVGALIEYSAVIGVSLLHSAEARDILLSPNKRGGEKGGRESGKTRKKKRQKWEAIAGPRVIEILENDPNLSQDDIVLEVAASWKHKTPKCPGTGTLKPFVAKIKNASKSPNNVLKFK